MAARSTNPKESEMQEIFMLGRTRFKAAIATLLAATAVAVAVPAATQPTQAEAIPVASETCEEWFHLWAIAPVGSDMEWFYKVLLRENCGY
jgi:hypothetical protein